MKETIKTINEIVKRAMGYLPDWDRTTIFMDLLVLAESGYGMKWDELLKADTIDFLHDVTGINRHLNRNTYKLEDFFVPRFAK